MCSAHWEADYVVSHGVALFPAKLPGFCADLHGEIVGFVSYVIEGGECEIALLISDAPGQGIGTALMQAVEDAARKARCRRLWLMTTNDDLNALRFYQKRGFVLVAVHCGAAAQACKLKPQIPLLGDDGIPIRDEIELEMEL